MSSSIMQKISTLEGKRRILVTDSNQTACLRLGNTRDAGWVLENVRGEFRGNIITAYDNIQRDAGAGIKKLNTQIKIISAEINALKLLHTVTPKREQ